MKGHALVVVALVLLVLFVMVVVISGGGSADTPTQPDQATVTGTALYGEQTDLPPSAVFEAILEDVSKADAKAEVIGRVRIEWPSPPPIPFTIRYDPAHIDDRHTYSVRARIIVDEKLTFTTDQAYPVLTRGSGNEVELVLRRVAGPHGAAASPVITVPASFAGDLPCADCEGMRYQLELVSDSAYFLRIAYLGRGDEAVTDRIGSWSYARESECLILWDDTGPAEQFQIVDHNILRKLDRKEQPIDSALNYDLKRTDGGPSLEPQLTMRGMYRSEAEAAFFTECTTGHCWPVMPDGESAAVQNAYLAVRRRPDDQLLVDLTGRIALKPLADQSDRSGLSEPQHVVIVDSFAGIWPGETCGARLVTSDLEGTRWVLTRLGDAPVVVTDARSEPYLVLQRSDRLIIGFGGCNRLTGNYELENSSLSFHQLALTTKACQDGMQQETALITALEQVRSVRLTSQHLELNDESGNLLARFEARNLD